MNLNYSSLKTDENLWDKYYPHFADKVTGLEVEIVLNLQLVKLMLKRLIPSLEPFKPYFSSHTVC